MNNALENEFYGFGIFGPKANGTQSNTHKSNFPIKCESCSVQCGKSKKNNILIWVMPVLIMQRFQRICLCLWAIFGLRVILVGHIWLQVTCCASCWPSIKATLIMLQSMGIHCWHTYLLVCDGKYIKIRWCLVLRQSHNEEHKEKVVGDFEASSMVPLFPGFFNVYCILNFTMKSSEHLFNFDYFRKTSDYTNGSRYRKKEEKKNLLSIAPCCE